ncbi:hypothetical protein D3C76_1163580 [compost metagenome]
MCDQRIEFFLATGTDHHIGPFGGKQQCCGMANTRTGTGDDCSFASQAPCRMHRRLGLRPWAPLDHDEQLQAVMQLLKQVPEGIGTLRRGRVGKAPGDDLIGQR